MRPIPLSGSPVRRSSWIPYALMGGLLVVILVNAALVHFALSSWTGLATGHAYDEGLTYNRVLAEARAEAAQGWHVSMRVTGSAQDARLVVEATDRSGAPLSDLDGEAVWTRPLGQEETVETGLTPLGAGRYAANAALPARGQWELAVVLRRGTESRHLLGRVHLP
jgi:nitrogen fixation protein FixH